MDMIYIMINMRRIITEITEDLKRFRRHYLLLLGIVIIASFLRLWGLGNVPFVADEFLDVNATYGYFKTGQWQAWDFNHNDISTRMNAASDARAWMYRIQVAWLYNYLPPTEFTVRLISVLWGIATTMMLYTITLSFTKNRWVALLASFLWAVSIPALEINRKIRMYSMFAPIFLFFMWSVFQLMESRIRNVLEQSYPSLKILFAIRWWYVIPVFLSGLLAMHLHPLAGNFVIVLCIYVTTMIFVTSEVMRRRYLGYLLLLIVLAIFVRFARPAEWGFFTQSLTITEHLSYITHLLRSYWHPLLGSIVIMLGAWSLIHDPQTKKAGIWIGSTFFGISIMAIFFWARNVGPQYIFFVQPFGMILAAAGVVYCAKWLQNVSRNKKAFVYVICAACVMLPNYGYFFEKNNTYHITASAETVNYRKVFDYVKRNYVTGDVLVTRNFRNYYWSDLGARVYDFGSERSEDQLEQEGKVKKITRAYIEEIVAQNPSGWVIIADNDEIFVEKEAQEYFDAHMERMKGSSLLNGDVRVYRWGSRTSI